ncbi:MAG: LysR family transcriptional regulator [Mesorhizobium sp.]
MGRPRLDATAIETFITIAELGSFSKAADKLNVTQPSISSRLHRLEADLGIRLIDRSTHSISLTDAGQRFFQRTRPLLAELQSALDEFSTSRVSVRRLALAASPMIAATVLPTVLHRFRDSHPDVELVLRDASTAQALTDLADGLVDFAIMAWEGDDPRFQFHPLFTDACGVVAPNGHPLTQRPVVTLADLAGYDLVLPSSQVQLKLLLMREFQKQGLKIRQYLSASSVHTVLRMVEAGMGLSVVSRKVFSGARIDGLAMIPIEGSNIVRTFGILMLEGRRLSRVEQELCRHVSDVFSEISD